MCSELYAMRLWEKCKCDRDETPNFLCEPVQKSTSSHDISFFLLFFIITYVEYLYVHSFDLYQMLVFFVVLIPASHILFESPNAKNVDKKDDISRWRTRGRASSVSLPVHIRGQVLREVFHWLTKDAPSGTSRSLFFLLYSRFVLNSFNQFWNAPIPLLDYDRLGLFPGVNCNNGRILTQTNVFVRFPKHLHSFHMVMIVFRSLVQFLLFFF